VTTRADVALVIASYNSGTEIEQTLERVRSYLDEQPYSHEIIVVNDGSTDPTTVSLERFSLRCAELRVLVNGRNTGKGYSVTRGVLETNARAVFFTDADLAYPVETIASFLRPLRDGTHDVVIGSRLHTGSLFHLHPRHFRYVYRRHLMSRTFNWMVRTVLGLRVMDTQCGFKGFTGDAARAIFSQVRTHGFAFDVEVLLIAQRLGFRVLELPVTFAHGGEVSTVKVLRTAAEAAADLVRIYLRDLRGRYRSVSQDFVQRA
jgi:dolichyl-phosphate beta-glucosyltransferase